MLKEKLTLLIHSCEKYSDLWDAHIELLNRNWGDRHIDTFIVTDAQNGRVYDGVTVFSAGEGKEITERTQAVLPEIKTEYVLVTLDDYFLTKKINTEKIADLVSEMEERGLDYIRLFPYPGSTVRIEGSANSLYKIDLFGGKSDYYVNLYPGIWKKEFIEKTLSEPMNAWKYEISLTKTAQSLNASCAMSKGREFEILDVIRKGKVLHGAERYFKKDPVYNGPRDVISRREELAIDFKTWLKKVLPRRVVISLKKIMIKCGMQFYSDLD